MNSEITFILVKAPFPMVSLYFCEMPCKKKHRDRGRTAPRKPTSSSSHCVLGGLGEAEGADLELPNYMAMDQYL